MLARFLAVTLALEFGLYCVLAAVLVRGEGGSASGALVAALAIFFGWRLGVTIVTFAIARLAARGDHSGPLTLVRLVLTETLAFAFGYGVLQALEPLLRRWLDRPSGTGPTLLLVHGYRCNAAIWAGFVLMLRRSGYVVRTVTLEPLHAGIDTQADALATFIAGAGLPKRFTIVAHSMGGLVARAYVRRYGASRLERLITIASPHRGTVLAALGQGHAAQDMHPGSPFLAALWAARDTLAVIPGGVVTLYSNDDNLVAPARSAVLPDAITVCIPGQGHVAMTFSPRVLRALLAALPRTRGECPASAG